VAADDLWEFACLIPAGTAKAAPLVIPTVFPQRIVEEVHWRIPPGAAGVVGFQIGNHGVPIFPQNDTQFIVAASHSTRWIVRDQPEGGTWCVIGYNTGAFPHTVYVTYLTKLIRPVPDPFRLFRDDELSDYPIVGIG
jgi:hypothetical protein